MADVYSAIILDNNYWDGTASWAGEISEANRDAKYSTRRFVSVGAWVTDRVTNSQAGDDEYAIISGPWASADITQCVIWNWAADAVIVDCPLTLPAGDNLASNDGIYGNKANAYKNEYSGGRNFYLRNLDIILIGVQAKSDTAYIPAINMRGDSNTQYVKRCVVEALVANGDGISDLSSVNSINYVENCVAYADRFPLELNASVDGHIINCTVNGNVVANNGIRAASGVKVKNNAVFNIDTVGNDFDGTVTDITFCASDDGDGTDAVDWDNESTDWARNFRDYVNFDHRPLDADLVGAGDGPINDADVPTIDIVGNVRKGTTCTIGAHEYQLDAPIISFATTRESLGLASPTEKPPFGMFEIDPNHPLSQELAVCLQIDEGGGDQLFDLCSYIRGTLNGSSAFVNTPFGPAFQTDTSQEQPVSLDRTLTFMPGKSFEIVVIRDSVAGSENQFCGFNDANNYASWIYGSTTIRIQDNDSGDHDLTVDDPLVGVLYHIVCVCDPDDYDYHWYINGIYQGAASAASDDTFLINTLGHGYTGTTYVWDGSIHRFRFWDRDLTAGEVMQLYADPYCFLRPKESRALSAPIEVVPKPITREITRPDLGLWTPDEKPPFGSIEINPYHPLTQNMAHCFLLNEQAGLPFDLVTGVQATAFAGGMKWRNSIKGRGLYSDSNEKFITKILTNDVITAQGSIFIGLVPLADADGYAFHMGDSLSDDTFRVYESSADAPLLRLDSVVNLTFDTVGSLYAELGYHTYLYTWDEPNNLSYCCKDGVDDQSLTTTFGPNLATGYIEIGDSYDGFGNLCVTLFVAFWPNRRLSKADALLLHTDPYCFLQPKERTGPVHGVPEAISHDLLTDLPRASSGLWLPDEKPSFGMVEIDPTHPLSQNLIGCWLFNEGGGNKVYDLSKGKNVGTLEATVGWVPTSKERGLYFPGGGKVVNASPIDISLGSIEFRFRVDSWVGNAGSLSGDTSSIFNNFIMVSQYSNLISMEDFGGNNLDFGNFSAPNLALGTWYTLLITTDGSNWFAYFYSDNGLQVSDSDPAYTTFYRHEWLGEGYTDSEFDGEIALVRVWDRQLSAVDGALLHADPYCFLRPKKSARIAYQAPSITLGWTWGEQNPSPEAPVPWSDFTVKESAVDARDTGDWGKLQLILNDEFVSGVEDTGDTTRRLLTLTYDDYASGSGTGTLWWRGQATTFNQDDNEVAGPTWEEYTGPANKSWRYIQVMCEG